MILEEGNRPPPWFPKCYIFVLHKDLKIWHIDTAFFRRGEERKRRRLAEEEARAGTDTEITAYVIPLAPVTSFKYLGIILSVSVNNWPLVVHNIHREQ